MVSLLAATSVNRGVHGMLDFAVDATTLNNSVIAENHGCSLLFVDDDRSADRHSVPQHFAPPAVETILAPTRMEPSDCQQPKSLDPVHSTP